MVFHSSTEGNIVVGLSVTLGILTIVAVLVRLFSRLYITRAVGLDDGLICIAGLLSWAFIITTIIAVRYGLGSRGEIPLDQLSTYLRVLWISSIFYYACLAFVKASVLAFYLRLGDPILQYRARIMIVVIGCQGAANTISAIFQCHKLGDLTGQCFNIDAFYLSTAILNIITDAITCILPIGLVIKLQMPIKQKCFLGVMFSLGLFATTSSIIRVVLAPRILIASPYDIGTMYYWSTIETNVGILAASIPSFKAILKLYLPRVLGDYKPQTRATISAVEFNSQRAENTHSGFIELSEDPMKTVYSHSTGIVNTEITSDNGKRVLNSASSSSEMIIPMQGTILAETQISTQISRHVLAVSSEEDVADQSRKNVGQRS